MIPCKECLLIPICRYKKFQSFVKECPLILDLLYLNRTFDSTCRRPSFNSSILKIEQVTKPTEWKTFFDDYGYAKVLKVT